MQALVSSDPTQDAKLAFALEKARDKAAAKHVELQALHAAWKKENPNKKRMLQKFSNSTFVVVCWQKSEHKNTDTS